MVCLFAGVALLVTGFAPQSYDELCLQGRRCLEEKQSERAIESYTQAIKLSAEQNMAYFGRALAYKDKGNFDLAIADCSEAIRLSPKEAVPYSAYLLRAECHEANNDLERALADITEAIERDRSRAQLYLARARIHHKKGGMDRAIYDFTKAAELDPQDMTAVLGRAQAYSDNEDYDRAIEDYSEAIRRNGKVAGYYFLRAKVRFLLKDYDRVIVDCGEAVRMDPAFSAAYGLRGVSWFEKRDFDRAITDLNEVIRQMPADIDAYVWRGRAYREKDDLPKAIAEFSEALRMNPKYQKALVQRARAYDKLGDEPKAQADWKLILPPAPPDSSKQTVFDRMKSLAVPAIGTDKPEVKSLAKTDPTAILADLARRDAEAERRKALDAQRAAEAVDAKAVVPEQWEAADDLMVRSRALEDKGDFETAAWGFRRAQERFSVVIQEVDRVLASSPGLWFGWAREKAERVTDSTKKGPLWLTLAETSRQLGDDDGYSRAMEKAVAAAKSASLLDPAVGVQSLLAIADVRYRHQDTAGAMACVREAAVSCEGIDNASIRACSFSLCAGYFTRLGDTAGWDMALEKASQCIPQIARKGGYFKECAPFSIKCFAYCEAGDWERAFSQVRQMEHEIIPERRSTNPDYFAVEYARVALTAVRYGSDTKAGREMFERAYVAACFDLARFGHWQEGCSPDARRVLAQADAMVGARDRAWIAAVHLPKATDRAAVVADIARKQVELKRYEHLDDLLKILPPEVTASPVVRWVAEAETRAGRKPMAELKRWANEMQNPEDSAAALAGIGVGTKNRQQATSEPEGAAATRQPITAGSSPGGTDQPKETTVAPAAGEILRANRTNPQVRAMFDKAAASVPKWWIDRAIALTNEVPDALTKTALWLRIAVTQADVGDVTGYRLSMEQATHSAVASWESMCFEQNRGRNQPGTSFRPRFVTGGIDANTGRIGAIIEALLEIETTRHQHGETRESIDVLLCGLRCAEVLHRSPGDFYSFDKAWTPQLWLARIAGRFRLRGRSDLADLMPFRGSGDRVATNFPSPHMALVFIEAEDESGMQQLVEAFKNHEVGAGCAATIYAHLAELAARKGDADVFRKNAMTVSGLTTGRRHAASPIVFLKLAHAAAVLGETDLAREYVERSKAGGSQRDLALAQVIEQMARKNQLAEARTLVADLRDGPARVRARYAVVRAEAAATSAKLSTLFEDVESCPTAHEKAAALAGVAATVLKNADASSTSEPRKP